MKYYIEIKNKEHSIAVQNRLFELGCKWNSGRKIKHENMPRITVGQKYQGSMTFGHLSWEIPEGHKKISLDDLYEMNEEDFFGKSYKEVELNAEYTAKVYSDRIEVGYHTFDIGIIQELSDALESLD